MYMSEKHVIANRKKWQKIAPELRTETMQARALIRWKHATPEQRKQTGEALTHARNGNPETKSSS